MIRATRCVVDVLQVPPWSGHSIPVPGQRGCKLRVSLGTPLKPPKRCWPCSSSWRLHLKAGDWGGTANVAVEELRQTPQATRAGRLWVPVTFLYHQTPSPGKGGPLSPECLRGSLHCRFLSQDDVNNVTFLQHLSVCVSVNSKPGEE